MYLLKSVGPSLAKCRVVNPFSLEKMTYLPETGEVAYRSKRNHATGLYK